MDNDTYAGFWLRFLAVIIDSVISVLFGLTFTIFFLSVFGLFSYSESMSSALSTVFFILYYTIMEASPYQATLGKMVVGLKVTDKNGDQLTYLRSMGRTFAKYLSAIILFIGYIMAGFTKQKQALHDIIAGCLVIRDPDKEPQVGKAIGTAILGLLLTFFIGGYYATHYLLPKLASVFKEEMSEMDISFNISPPSQQGAPIEGEITIKKKDKVVTLDLGSGKMSTARNKATASATSNTISAKNPQDVVEKQFRYLRRNRRDPFLPLLNKEIVQAEEKAKREKEMAKIRQDMEQAASAEQDIGDLLGDLFSSDNAMALAPPEPEITFPDIEISGIMWDPYDPVLTIIGSDNIYRQGDLISEENGFTYIVGIQPDSIILEKNQNGRVKQKLLGIIRGEEVMNQ